MLGKITRTAPLITPIVLGIAASANSEVLINEDFSGPSVPSGVFINHNSNSNTGLSLSSGALQWSRKDNESADQRHSLWSYFPAQTLNDGDALVATGTVSLDTLPNSSNNLRIGLLRSNGSQQQSNAGGGNPPNRRDDVGFGIALGIQNSSTGNEETTYIQELGNTNGQQPLSQGLSNPAIAALGSEISGSAIDSAEAHEIELRLTRDGSDLVIQAFLDGASIGTGRTASPSLFEFDQIAIVQEQLQATPDPAEAQSTLTLDDLKVEFVPVPEPGSSVMLTTGLICLALRRRLIGG